MSDDPDEHYNAIERTREADDTEARVDPKVQWAIDTLFGATRDASKRSVARCDEALNVLARASSSPPEMEGTRVEAVEAVLFDWVGKQEKPLPRSRDEWGPVCVGCGSDEYRIDGFCSSECRDRYEFGLEIRAALHEPASTEREGTGVDSDYVNCPTCGVGASREQWIKFADSLREPASPTSREQEGARVDADKADGGTTRPDGRPDGFGGNL